MIKIHFDPFGAVNHYPLKLVQPSQLFEAHLRRRRITPDTQQKHGLFLNAIKNQPPKSQHREMRVLPREILSQLTRIGYLQQLRGKHHSQSPTRPQRLCAGYDEGEPRVHQPGWTQTAFPQHGKSGLAVFLRKMLIAYEGRIADHGIESASGVIPPEPGEEIIHSDSSAFATSLGRFFRLIWVNLYGHDLAIIVKTSSSRSYHFTVPGARLKHP